MTKCDCDLCKRSRKFKRILKKLKNSIPNTATAVSYYLSYKIEFVTNKDIKWFEDLYNHLLDVEESYDLLKQTYKILSDKTGYKAYLDGTIEKNKCLN